MPSLSIFPLLPARKFSFSICGHVKLTKGFIVWCAVMAGVVPPVSSAVNQNWPQFRGPNSSGISEKAKPPISIGPTNGVLWQVEVPWSPSSPCVWGDRIFLTTFERGELQTRSYARKDGKLLWTRSIKPEKLESFHNSEGSPAASTPATDGQRVVSYFGSAGFVCHDFNLKNA